MQSHLKPLVQAGPEVRRLLTRARWFDAARALGLSNPDATLLWQLIPTSQEERRKRIPSAETVRRNGWTESQFLKSVSWKRPVKLVHIHDTDVVVVDHDGVRRVIGSFPADVDVCAGLPQDAPATET